MNHRKQLAKTIMIQGTGSFVGKSVLVAALCRIFKQEGYRVAPFKSQNMSLNSYIAADNKEISRAQAMQAEAAGIEPTVHMNPILLKPTGSKTQVVLLGKPIANLTAQEYQVRKQDFWLEAKRSLELLRKEYEIVVIEGAGSPAEINIPNDICNMKVAAAVNSPVLIIGDIDKGGIFASFIGTLGLLSSSEKKLIKGFIINKFRGDSSLLKPGLDFLHEKTGIPVLGVIPYSPSLSIPEEDSQSLDEYSVRKKGILKIGVIRLPHIANFSDFDKISREPAINLRYFRQPQEIDRLDMLIIPGSKNTISDLIFLKEEGWARKIKELIRQRVPILAICAGFQMMGGIIRDPDHLESEREAIAGLGLLDIATTFSLPKQTYKIKATPFDDLSFIDTNSSLLIEGYEIHMGRTIYGLKCKPAFRIVRRGKKEVSIDDGACDPQKQIIGTYIHDLLENDCFRRLLIAKLLKRKGLSIPNNKDLNSIEQAYDNLAELARKHLDLQYILELLQLETSCKASVR